MLLPQSQKQWHDLARALLPPPVAAAPVNDCDIAAADTKAPSVVALPTTTAPPPTPLAASPPPLAPQPPSTITPPDPFPTDLLERLSHTEASLGELASCAPRLDALEAAVSALHERLSRCLAS